MSKNTGLGRGLGRGLGALLGNEADEVTGDGRSSAVDTIAIDLLEPNPWQPRTDFNQEELEELSASIKNFGIIQPLTLRKYGDRYQIIAGERRYRAAKMAGLESVPAYVLELEDSKMLAVAILENIQRSDLNPMEEALSYQRLIDECNLTQEGMAEYVGKKRSTITNYLRLLKLPEEIQNGVREKLITMGHARAIMGVEDIDTMLMLYHELIEQGYSVRTIEELVRKYNEGETTEEQTEEPAQKRTKREDKTPEEYAALGNQLSSYFSVPVKFSCNNKGKGKITIPFATQEELERIMEILDTARQADI